MSVGIPALLLLFLPLWQESVQGRFVLEPARRSVLRAEVPGRVVEVNAEEGAAVAAGVPLVRLRDLRFESELARAQSDYRVAAHRALQAQLKNADYAPLEQERYRLGERNRTLSEEAARLTLASSIPGVVITPQTQNLLGLYLKAGAEVMEVADASEMKAKIYVAEDDLRKIG